MSLPRVVVLDHGSGNVHSATRALAAAGARVELSSDPEHCRRADGLVVPGVGAFAACMAGLQTCGGPEIIAQRLAQQRPVLGICVGHQVLFAEGLEHDIATRGLGIYEGSVTGLRTRIRPHMGWNQVAPPAGSKMFSGIEGERFYFVHSYAAHQGPEAGTAWTEYDNDRFVAAVEGPALWSTQFHPEKSGQAGARLLANWLASIRK